MSHSKKNRKKNIAAIFFLALIVLISLVSCKKTTEPRIAVMPLLPAEGQAYDGTGVAIQYLLENAMLTNVIRDKFRLFHAMEDIFPEVEQYRAYIRGQGSPVDFRKLGESHDVLYWITGTYELRGGKIIVKLVVIDVRENRRFAISELIVDTSDSLAGFREECFDWLNGAKPYIPMPQLLYDAALWPEMQSIEGLAALGDAYAVLVEHSYPDAKKKTINLAPFVSASEKAPDSYLATNLLGWAQAENEDWESARESFQEALEINPTGWSSFDGMVACARANGKKEAALRWSENKTELNLMSSWRETLLDLELSLSRLAWLEGDHATEKEYAEKAVALAEKWFGKKHPKVAPFLHNAGIAYKSLNEYSKARVALENALSIDEDRLRSDHIRIARTLNLLAIVYEKLGDYPKAESVCQRALSILEKRLGKEDAEVAWCANNLGVVYLSMGKYTSAKSQFERALSIHRKHHDDDNPTFLHNLGDAYYELRDYENAEFFFEKSLYLTEEVFGKDHPNVADELNSLGLMYERTGRYGKAKALLERALEIDRKHFGDDNPAVARDLNALGLLYGSLEEHRKAVDHHEKALSIMESRLDEYSPKLASYISNLGAAYQTVGEYDKALALRKRKLAIARKNFGDEHPAVAEALTSIGVLYAFFDYSKSESFLEQALFIYEKNLNDERTAVASELIAIGLAYELLSEHRKARELVEKGLVLAEKRLGDNHPDVAVYLNHLGTICFSLGDYSEAKSNYERALSIIRGCYREGHPQEAAALNDIGMVYLALDENRKAIELFERAMSMNKEVFGESCSEIASNLNNLGVAYSSLGEYAAAKSCHEQALSMYKNHLEDEHPAIAMALNNVGTLYGDLGDYGRAMDFYEQALSMTEKRFGSDNSMVALNLINLGSAYQRLGDRVRALEIFERALLIAKTNFGDGHPLEAVASNRLGTVYVQLQDFSKARDLFERALFIAEEHYGDFHYEVSLSVHNLSYVLWHMGDLEAATELCERAVLIAERLQNPIVIAYSYAAMSANLSEQNKPQAAVFFGKKAVNRLQSVRSGISGMEIFLQRAFVKGNEDVYRHLADLLIEQGRLPEAHQIMSMLKEEEYFDFIRRDAGQSDVRKTLASYAPIEVAWMERYRKIHANLASLGEEYDILIRKKKLLGLTLEEKKRFARIKDDLKVARKAFGAFLEEIDEEVAMMAPERAREVGEMRLEGLKALQGTLRDLGDAATLHYLAFEDSLHMILTFPGVQLVRHRDISQKELNQKIFDFRQTLQAPSKDPLPESQDLYEIVFGPVADDLRQAGIVTVMVSLDGAMRYLPLPALHDGQHYVAERFQIVVFTEAADTKLKDRPPVEMTLAGMGLSREIVGFIPLPAVEKELAGLHEMLPGVIYLNEDFTRAAFEDSLEMGYSLLHVASHFVFSPGTEKDSFLLLGDGSRMSLAQLEDGNYDFNAVDQLALPACNTAMGGGKNAYGKEIESFGVMAQRMGAKSVLATLWPVADESTGAFMLQYYRMRKERKATKAEALQLAQTMFIRGETSPSDDAPDEPRGRIVLDSNAADCAPTGFVPPVDAPLSHPYYWAPFILMGNWQ